MSLSQFGVHPMQYEQTVSYASPPAPARPSPLVLLARAFNNVIVTLVGLYGLSLTAFVLARATVGVDWFRPLGLLLATMPVPLLPALPLAALALLLRRWRLFILLLLPVLAFVVQYGAFFVPRTPPSAPGTPLTVMTYNLLARDGDWDRIAGMLLAHDADIIAVQELTDASAEVLAERLEAAYPYQALYPEGRTVIGSGIFSRFPISDVRYTVETMGNIRVEIDAGARSLVLYNLHPALPVRGLWSYAPETRDAELNAVLAEVRSETLPVLVVGDLNLNDQEALYRAFDRMLDDAWARAGSGLGLTYLPVFRGTSAPALLRIDYVWYSSSFYATDAHVVAGRYGSDHHPLLAHLVLRDRDPDPSASMPD
jgi:endonuclease/exonuclease/phosphatase (EEP) superfamily protein YafD